MNKEKIYLCDIDKTLADNSHRSPFDETKVSNDKPLPTCEVIKSLLGSGAFVVFLSGRSTRCYNDTHDWIKNNIGVSLYNHALFMRSEGDGRADEIIKKELYEIHIKDKYEVIGVFDDRLKVCRMWWELGLFVFNCNQGNIEF